MVLSLRQIAVFILERPGLFHRFSFLCTLFFGFDQSTLVSEIMPPLHQLQAYEMTEGDIEKRGEVKCVESDITTITPSSDPSDQHDIPHPPVLKDYLAKWNAKVEGLAGLEARGIKRVLPEEKHECGRREYLHMFGLWFGINFVVMSIITGLLGPLVYQLGWVDCVCIIIFANALSCCAPGYISTFGPQSGNRTMVGARVGHIPHSHWSSCGSLGFLRRLHRALKDR